MIDTQAVRIENPLETILPRGRYDKEKRRYCPFCQPMGKGDPALQIYGDRYKCHKCNDGGDVIDYMMRTHSVTFGMACDMLGAGFESAPIAPKMEPDPTQKTEPDVTAQLQTEKRKKLNASGVWLKYHNNLDRLDMRPIWHKRGLSDYFIDLYQVGYCESHCFDYSEEIYYPTLTIPTWKSGAVINIAHRALVDNASGGKYRPEYSGLGKSLFYGDPGANGMPGKVLLIEGEIKTAVTFAMIWGAMPATGHPLHSVQITGTAGKSWKPDWTVEFENASEIYIAQDPDVWMRPAKAAENWKPSPLKIADQLGRGRCKIVELPDKIDDLILAGALDKDTLWEYMRRAR